MNLNDGITKNYTFHSGKIFMKTNLINQVKNGRKTSLFEIETYSIHFDTRKISISCNYTNMSAKFNMSPQITRIQMVKAIISK